MNPQVPDTPETPPIVVPSAPARQRWAWAVLFGLFAMFVALAVAPYLFPEAETDGFKPPQLASLRLAYVERQMRSNMKPGALTPNQTTALGDIEKATAQWVATDPEAAMLNSVARRELGQEPDAKALPTLRKSRDGRHQAAAELLSSKSLTPNRAEELAAEFGDANLLRKLAAVQARELAGDKKSRGRLISTTDIALISVVNLGALALVVSGLILWVLYGVQRGTGSWKPLGGPLAGISAAGADGLAWRMALFLLASVAVPVLLWPLKSAWLSETGLMALSSLAVLACSVIAIRARVLGAQGGLRALLGRTDNLPGLAAWGVGGFVANVPVVVALVLIGTWLFRGLPPPSHPLSEEIMSGVAPFGFFLAALVAVVLAPVTEELTFRGLLFPALGRFIGVAGGVVVSGLFFASIHPQGPAMVLALAAVGGMGAALAHQTRSLVPAIVMHALHNAAVLSAALILA